MKTIQELYSEVMGSEELKAQFIETAKAGKQESFLKEHGCDATLEEVAAFLKAKSEEDAPLSLDELENSAGGACKNTMNNVGMSIISLGIGCTVFAIKSAVKGNDFRSPEEGGVGCSL